MSPDSYHANVEAIRSARELIDITRKELDILKSLIYEGSHPLNVRVAELEKDIEALTKTLETLNESLTQNSQADALHKEITDKRLKALERVAWMGIGAITILSAIITYFKGSDWFA